ncbi:tryptophan synthase [Cryptococcus neoformans]|nr:tryptophan synthase [Cryptococcus neoformans var. grubii]
MSSPRWASPVPLLPKTSQPRSLNSSSVSRRSPPFPSLSVLVSTTVPTLTMSHLPVLMLLSLDPKSSSSSLSTPMTVLRPRWSKTIAEKSHSRARTLPLLAERMLRPPLLPLGESQVKVTAAGKLPSRFGLFGGAYVAESLVDCLNELEAAYAEAKEDPAFWKEFEDMFGYINRPSELYLAERLTEEMGGARIWLKREDLNHTGSHKINNAVGQILLAKRLGKRRIIAETGAGQHGVATATVCARFGMECDIFMGAEDVRRQELNVFRIKMLGGRVIPVTAGSQTLKDAVNEAMRDWVTRLDSTHYLIGSAIGPHPFPTIVRDFQRVIGREIKSQMHEKMGKLPDAVVACVGGGSNAIGTFYDFIENPSVRLVGVEAGGHGVDTEAHSATLTKGVMGVVHGAASYIIQSKEGQLVPTHSISAGLDYNSVGPEHSHLKYSGRAEYVVADDLQCLKAFKMCTELEGIIPALESSHGLWGGMQLAKSLPKDKDIVICLSGNGAKDVAEVLLTLKDKEWADKLDWHVAQ